MILLKEDFVSNPFVTSFGVEAISSGKIDDFRHHAGSYFTRSGSLINGNTRKIADFLIQAGQRIKQGTFPAVRVPYQCDMNVLSAQSEFFDKGDKISLIREIRFTKSGGLLAGSRK